jgi:uncharacterized membrane protein
MPLHLVALIFGILLPIAFFVVLLTIARRLNSPQKEREAFYKSETLRRITEASGEGAKAAIELLREDERLKQVKRREGIKLGGVISLGVGLGLVIFLWAMVGPKLALCGLIPGLVGVAFLVYVYFLAPPVE